MLTYSVAICFSFRVPWYHVPGRLSDQILFILVLVLHFIAFSFSYDSSFVYLFKLWLRYYLPIGQLPGIYIAIKLPNFNFGSLSRLFYFLFYFIVFTLSTRDSPETIDSNSWSTSHLVLSLHVLLAPQLVQTITSTAWCINSNGFIITTCTSPYHPWNTKARIWRCWYDQV